MKEIVIVGCGRLGSILSYLIVLKNKDIGGMIKKITLIDNDIVENKNMPYLFVDIATSPNLLNSPKSLLLKYQLDILNTGVTINSIYDDFNSLNMIPTKGSYFIDCRDEFNELDIFKLKLCLDGTTGKVILNPKQSHQSSIKNVNYTFNRTYFIPYYFLSYICSMFIFNKISLKRKRMEFILDLDGCIKSYELLNTKNARC